MSEARDRAQSVIAKMHANNIILGVAVEERLTDFIQDVVDEAIMAGRRDGAAAALNKEDDAHPGNGLPPGQTQMEVGRSGDDVWIQFPTMVRQVSMPPRDARKLAEMLRQASYGRNGR